MAIVIDSSIALEWILDQNRASSAETVFRRPDDLLVHPLFWLEIVHVLIKQQRVGLLTAYHRDQAWLELQNLRLTTLPGDTAHALLPRVMILADEHRLSAYDAAHLAAALHLNAELATLDHALSAATLQAGGALLSLS
jgi:predicted nucleic acid-binding protein